MGQKKEFKKLKKRVKDVEKNFKRHRKNTEKHFTMLENLLSDFNEKLTEILTIRRKSENGVHEKKVEKAGKKK